MRAFTRSALVVLSIAGAVACLAVVSSPPALAQAKDQAKEQAAPAGQPTELKQIALTEKQVDGVLASQKEMDTITEKLPENGQPDAKMMAQLDGVAKKHGFASYEDYNLAVDNIGLVMNGIDPATKKYVGSEAVIKAQITQVEADKKMTAPEKKQALENLNMALKAKDPEIQNKGNIDLVVKYYDKLAAALSEDMN
jgi:hypothetical protein